MDYSAERKTLNPVYDDCPAFCYQDGERRSEYCENCEVLAARNTYRETADEQLTEYGRGGNINFDYLSRCVIDVLQFEQLPRERLTVTAAALVNILEGERQRVDRLKDWNKANSG